MPSSSSGSWTGSSAGWVGPAAPLAPVEPAHDLAAQADGVELVGGQVVGQARAPGRAWTPRPAPRRRTPRRWPSSPAAARPGRPWSAARSSRCSRSCPGRRRRRRWSCRRPGPWWARRRPSCRVRSRKARPPGMKISAWAGRSAPPDSTRLIDGRRFWRAMSEARAPLRKEKGFMAPPRTVGSLAPIRHSTPSTTPMPDDEDAPTVVLGAPGGQGAQLEEGGVPVEEELDALAGQQLAPLPVALRRSAPRRRPGPRPAARRPCRGRRPGRAALARKVSEFGSMVVVRTGMVVGRMAGCALVGGSVVWRPGRIGRGRRGKNRPMTCAPRDRRGRRPGAIGNGAGRW